jgi:uncharacterized RDD family membrane protein YckC
MVLLPQREAHGGTFTVAHDVFISYAAEDGTVADAVCASLEASGTKCWVAPRDVLPGADYAQAIVEAISQSRIMILLLSSRSNDSPHVRREVERAVTRDIPVLPLRIEDVPLSLSLQYYIGMVQWYDAHTPPLEGHLQHLAETVSLLLSAAGRLAGLGVEAEATRPAPVVTALGDELPPIAEPEREPVAVSVPDRGPARASLRARAAAFGLDWLFAGAGALFLCVLLLIPRALIGASSEDEWQLADVPPLLALLLVPLCYQWLGNSSGKSLGKQLFQLSVVRNLSGGGRPLSRREAKLVRPGWRRGLLRTVVGLVGLLPLGLGYWWVLKDREDRAWHDIAAGTLVVRVE